MSNLATKMTHPFDIPAFNTDGVIENLYGVIKIDESDLAETTVEFYTAENEQSLGNYLVDVEELDERSFIIQPVAKRSIC
jgi:hypothetical protein